MILKEGDQFWFISKSFVICVRITTKRNRRSPMFWEHRKRCMQGMSAGQMSCRFII